MFRFIVLAIFVLAIVFFLIPWISISCENVEIFNASGMDMVRGSYNVPGDSDGISTENEPIAMYALIAAGVGVLVCIFRGEIWRILRVLAGLAGVGFLVWLKFHLDEQMQGSEESMLQLNYLIGYWLTLGALALAAVVSIFVKDGAPKYIAPTQTSTPPQYIPPPGGVPPPPPPPQT
jgi:hypothetical protein